MPAEINKQLFELGFDVTKHTVAMLAYWDKNLICRFANNAYFEWFGVRPEDMINKMHIRDILGPLYEKNLVHINGALNGKVQVFERPIPTSDGKTKIARATYIPDFKGGEVIGFYVHVADVSPLSSVAEPDEIEKSHFFSNERLLADVVQTLRSCILTGFPGIANLSKKHFISESKLKRDFKEKYNTTIFSFYRNLQMELADNYISEKRCTKNQMAVMLNFSNPSNFSVCYQKYLREKATEEQINKIKELHYDVFKTFVEQAPVDIAMLDNNLAFMAASQKYLDTRKINAKEYLGKYIFDIIPGTPMKYKEMLHSCLKGNTNVTEEAFVERPDGSSFWFNWEIKPWYTIDKQIGGLLINSEDITAKKLKEAENKQILEMLDKIHEIARIGTWSRDFKNNTVFWSKILKEMLEVPEDFSPDLPTAFKFYKEGASRNLAQKGLKDAVENGKQFDIELEMITAKGNLIRVRHVGYPEFHDGRCEKISGIFLDITHQKQPFPKI